MSDSTVWQCPTCGLVQHIKPVMCDGRMMCFTCISRYFDDCVLKRAQVMLLNAEMLPKPPHYAGPKTYNMVTG